MDRSSIIYFGLAVFVVVGMINKYLIVIKREEIFLKWRNAPTRERRILKLLFWLYVFSTHAIWVVLLIWFRFPLQHHRSGLLW
jgi:type VI protein secretion system component VasF